jgi:hypothetical protein
MNVILETPIGLLVLLLRAEIRANGGDAGVSLQEREFHARLQPAGVASLPDATHGQFTEAF